MFDDLSSLIIRIPVLCYAITVHEFAHAYVANKRGDDTAARLGRMSMNPLVHLDPIGTLCLIFGFFGWGKPVPVNPNNFKNRRWDDVLVSFAGPFSNFLSALVFGILLQLLIDNSQFFPGSYLPGAIHFLYSMVLINLGLAFFNLLPLFPLDGSHILRGFLPTRQRMIFDHYSRHAPMLLLLVLLFESIMDIPILSLIIYPPIAFFLKFFTEH